MASAGGKWNKARKGSASGARFFQKAGQSRRQALNAYKKRV